MLDIIEKPKVTTDLSEFYGRFVIEPLERGFGTTLGNSLRRVLLSSIEGAAVTHIHIDGVLHEFSTIPGVAEDVTEIILNIKKLRFNMLCDEPKKLTLRCEGEGVICAADIESDPEIEILNPDCYIAQITDKDASLNMELTVEKGRGYVQADKHAASGTAPVLGDIPVDSIFTPIVKTTYTVEDTRVGQITNYDRLIIEIWTDGSILPYTALGTAAGIIRDCMEFFMDIKPPSEVSEDVPESTEAHQTEIPIEDLGLSVRSLNCLKRAPVATVGDLVRMSVDDLMKLKNFGQKSLVEIQDKLKALGLELQPSARED